MLEKRNLILEASKKNEEDGPSPSKTIPTLLGPSPIKRAMRAIGGKQKLISKISGQDNKILALKTRPDLNDDKKGRQKTSRTLILKDCSPSWMEMSENAIKEITSTQATSSPESTPKFNGNSLALPFGNPEAFPQAKTKEEAELPDFTFADKKDQDPILPSIHRRFSKKPQSFPSVAQLHSIFTMGKGRSKSSLRLTMEKANVFPSLPCSDLYKRYSDPISRNKHGLEVGSCKTVTQSSHTLSTKAQEEIAFGILQKGQMFHPVPPESQGGMPRAFKESPKKRMHMHPRVSLSKNQGSLLFVEEETHI